MVQWIFNGCQIDSESNKDIEIDRKGFGDKFHSVNIVHKAAMPTLQFLLLAPTGALYVIMVYDIAIDFFRFWDLCLQKVKVEDFLFEWQ